MNKKKLIIVCLAVALILIAAIAIASTHDKAPAVGDAVTETVEGTNSVTSSDMTITELEVQSSEVVTEEPDEDIASSDADVTELPEDEVGETTADSVSDSDNDDPDKPLVIGSGINLMKLSTVDGEFVEDGSDDAVKGVMAATFKNVLDKTLQYAKLQIKIGEEVYNFEISTIPAGESVIAFETSRKSAPSGILGDVTMTAVHIVYFEIEQPLMEDTLEITVENGIIKIENISNESITRDFSVFYKNKNEETFIGGITYRVRIVDTLEPGKTLTGYASHAVPDESIIMFVQYDS